MDNPDPRRYREAEFALWGRAGTYRGFAPLGRDGVEPHLPRGDAERLVSELSSHFDVRFDGEAIVARLPDEPTVRAERDVHGLYAVGALGSFRNGVEWTEPFPSMPHGPLDAETIVALLDEPLPDTIHERNRQPVWDELHRRAGAADLTAALGSARTNDARERLCVLLAQHARPREALAALDSLESLLSEGDEHLRSSAAYALRSLVARAGHVRAAATAPSLASALRRRISRERDRHVRTDLKGALGALEGRAHAHRRFVRVARRSLDFLVAEYGFAEPTIDDGGWGTDVIYRTPSVGVVARAEWRDRYPEVLLVRLEDGDLPMYLFNETTLWVAPERIVGEDVPAHDADSPRLAESFEAWARALRRCGELLRGDGDALAQAIEQVRSRR